MIFHCKLDILAIIFGDSRSYFNFFLLSVSHPIKAYHFQGLCGAILVDLGYLGQLRFPESLLVPPEGWKSFPGYDLPVSLVGVERRILWRENKHTSWLLLCQDDPPFLSPPPMLQGRTALPRGDVFLSESPFLVRAIPPWAKGVLGLVSKESVSPGRLLSGVILTPSFLPVLQASLVVSVIPHLTWGRNEPTWAAFGWESGKS